MTATTACRASIVGGALILVLLGSSGASAGRAEGLEAAQTRVNQDAQLSAEFLKRVAAYVEIHRKADSGIPEVSNSATSQEVDAHRSALRRAIGAVRSRAQQGDIFTQDVRAYFRRQIARALAGADAAQIKSAILEDNPGAIRLRVNAPYPNTIPRSTMPPQILAALPKLPEELEYRFIGDRLILLDIHAELVADYMESALPR